MVRNSIRTTSSLLLLIICLSSCCHKQRGPDSISPDLVVSIPTGSSPYIYYDGLPELPESGGLVIAHTTVFDGGFRNEDNRLCAVNEKQGDICWFFPSDLDERHYFSFDGRSHSWRNRLMFQYCEDAREDGGLSTICLDATDGKALWRMESGRTSCSQSRDVAGDGATCFFIQGSDSLMAFDMKALHVSGFFHSDSLKISEISLWGKHLLLCCCTEPGSSGHFGNYAVVLNSRTGAIELPPHFIRNDIVPAQGVIDKGVLYANSDTYLTAVDIRSGERIWERDDKWAYTLMDMSVSGGVLLKCAGNATAGYDTASGRILYEYRNYGSWQTSVHGNLAFIVNRRQELDVMDVRTGDFIGNITCPYHSDGEFFSGSYPVIRGRYLHIMSYRHLFRYPILNNKALYKN